MLGAIAGDIIGSPYEGRPIKSTDFPLFSSRSRFTDDSVLTVATAAALLEGPLAGTESASSPVPSAAEFGAAYKRIGREYPNAGYGGMFIQWLMGGAEGPYGSFGNGSAMRVSPVGWAFDTPEAVLAAAEQSAACTHNHAEGIKGAQAAALALFLARRGSAEHGPGAEAVKRTVHEEISRRFSYDLDRKVESIRPSYRFDPTCQGTVPEAIVAALEAESTEEAIRLAISLGGDADTLASIAGAVAEPLFGGIGEEIESGVRARLPDRLLRIVDRFYDSL